MDIVTTEELIEILNRTPEEFIICVDFGKLDGEVSDSESKSNI